jgi:hypothetical protein
MGDADALACLQAIYANPGTQEANRLNAAAAAIAYERSKPASVVVQVDFKERVRAARLRQLELDRAEWAKADQQKKLDLEGPAAPTILGGEAEAETEAEGPPAASCDIAYSRWRCAF